MIPMFIGYSSLGMQSVTLIPVWACRVSHLFQSGHAECHTYSSLGMQSVTLIPVWACRVSHLFQSGHAECHTYSSLGMQSVTLIPVWACRVSHSLCYNMIIFSTPQVGKVRLITTHTQSGCDKVDVLVSVAFNTAIKSQKLD